MQFDSMNKTELDGSQPLDIILKMLLSASKSDSKPGLIRSILSHMSSLVNCDSISLQLGHGDDLEQSRAILPKDGPFSYQTIGSNESSSPSKGYSNGIVIIPSFLPNNAWPLQTYLWRQGKVQPKGTRFADQWSDWLQANAPLSGIKALLLHPFACKQHNDSLLGLAFSGPERPTSEEQKLVAQAALIIGLVMNIWQSMSNLRERVKELSCLYGLAQLLDPPGRTLDEVLQGVVDLLPPAWLYSRDASARIKYDGRDYLSSGYQDGQQKQVAPLMIGGKPAGMVEVNYKEVKPRLDEGPFLIEERKLLDNVARQTAQIIEKFLYESEKTQIMDKLRQADSLAMMGQVAATVAHEINEPLTSILGYAQLVAGSPDLPPQISPDVEKVVATSLHMREIVRKTLLFTRKIPPKSTEVDLNEAIRDTMELFEWRCRREGIDSSFKPTESPLKIIADPGQIRQIITNLAVNAIQSMTDGGDLRLEAISRPDWSGFSVADTGPGMTQEVIDKIYIPFYTTKEAGRGTGLGLSVVHDILNELGGHIEVQSILGSGTIFTVKFPHPKPEPL